MRRKQLAAELVIIEQNGLAPTGHIELTSAQAGGTTVPYRLFISCHLLAAQRGCVPISALVPHCLAWLLGVPCLPLGHNPSTSQGSLATSKPYRL